MTFLFQQKDLIVLTADKNMEFAVKGILGRSKSLGIREITVDFRVHPENDPGCLVRGHDFLKPFSNQYTHALILLDREGSGQDQKSRIHLESEIESRLFQSGWRDRAAAIVIDPELEIWVWSNSPHLDAVLGWKGKQPELRSWLQSKEYITAENIKPTRPKEALEDALKTVRKPRSSSIYSHLAGKISLERCIDASFLKLKGTLQSWFNRDNLIP